MINIFLFNLFLLDLQWTLNGFLINSMTSFPKTVIFYLFIFQFFLIIPTFIIIFSLSMKITNKYHSVRQYIVSIKVNYTITRNDTNMINRIIYG